MEWELAKRQHDPAEAVEAIFKDAGQRLGEHNKSVAHALGALLGLRAREDLWTTGNCRCHRDYCSTSQDSHHHIFTITVAGLAEQRADPGDEITLYNLIERMGDPERGILVDRPPCAECGCPVDNCKSVSIVGAQPVVLLALDRTEVASADFLRPAGWEEGRGQVVRQSMGRQMLFRGGKNRLRVIPNQTLEFGSPYFLHSAVVHKGGTPESGHYVCYVRNQFDCSWVRYDGDHCDAVHAEYPECQGAPETRSSTAAATIYFRWPQRVPDRRSGAVVGSRAPRRWRQERGGLALANDDGSAALGAATWARRRPWRRFE